MPSGLETGSTYPNFSSSSARLTCMFARYTVLSPERWRACTSCTRTYVIVDGSLDDSNDDDDDDDIVVVDNDGYEDDVW